MAAVLAGGARGLLSHRALAHHLDLFDGPGPRVVDVTVAGRSRAGVDGVRLHLPRTITRGEVVEVRGIPCTTTERLLADMAAPAAAATDAELATLVHRATVKRMIDRQRLATQLVRPADGIGRLRELIEPTGPDLRGKLEQRFWAFLRRGGWAGYEANVLLNTPLGPLRLDVFWKPLGFGLELDSWSHHGDRAAFEADRQRDIAADLIGVEIRRITWRMLTARPGWSRRSSTTGSGAEGPGARPRRPARCYPSASSSAGCRSPWRNVYPPPRTRSGTARCPSTTISAMSP